jgi:hypothetical protein
VRSDGWLERCCVLGSGGGWRNAGWDVMDRWRGTVYWEVVVAVQMLDEK